jgi:hypothetical protein
MNNKTKEVLRDILGVLEQDGGFIYLGGPYSGNEDYNYSEHEHCTTFLLRERIWVHSPIVHCHFMAMRNSMPKNALYWKDYNFALIKGSSGFVRYKLPGWEKSVGLNGEFHEALRLGKAWWDLELSDIP